MAAEQDNLAGALAEEVIEPELPICDTHVHLRDRPDIHYRLDEFLEDVRAGGHNIVQVVHVDCKTGYRESGPPEMRPVGETEYVEGLAARTAGNWTGVVGTVGYADLNLGDRVAPVLEAHISAGKHFRGIRHHTAWDPSPHVVSYGNPPGMLAAPEFRKGFACLGKLGLSYDAYVFHPQLMEIVDLARAVPGTTIILEHVGTPLGVGPYSGKRDEVFQVWKRSITAVAACPHIFVKLGGMGIRPCAFGWLERDTPPDSAEVAKTIAPYLLWCIEKFGVDRCMFESNFPVDKASYSYNVLWNAFKRVTEGFSPREKAALYQGSAARAYRLPSTG